LDNENYPILVWKKDAGIEGSSGAAPATHRLEALARPKTRQKPASVDSSSAVRKQRRLARNGA